MAYQARGIFREQSIIQLHALLELSGKSGEEVSWMVEAIKQAPDTATAIWEIERMLGLRDEALKEKWAKHIAQAWFAMHPHVPAALQLGIMSHDVMCADAILEIHALLQEFSKNPPHMSFLEDGGVLSFNEEQRIAESIHLFKGDIYAVRRAIAILEELRLVRPLKMRVHVVKSRYSRFQALPLSCQYYLIWHIDMYHLDWKEYVGVELSEHMAVFQQYLPMIWEMLENTVSGQVHMSDEFSWHVVRAFRPLWQQGNVLGLYEQSALQSMVDEWLVDKVLVRYGLIERHSAESSDVPKSFGWNRVGEILLESERTIKLPCAIDILH